MRIVFEQDTITAVVQDDGIGIPPQTEERQMENATHFGLRTVARQVEQLQGRFEIMRGEEGGTIIRAIVPITPELGRDSQ